MRHLRLASVLAAVLVALWLLGRTRGPDGPRTGPETGAAPALEPPRSQDGERSEPPAASAEGTLVGRIVDAHGEPWADLPLVAAGRTARTEASGAFELGGLPRAELALDLTSAFDPTEPLGVRRIACPVPPLAVDLRTVARLDVGTQVVPRSRPFWVEGKVELDAEWAAAEGLTPAEIRLHLRLAEPDDLGNLYRPEAAPLPGAPIDWNRPPWRAELPAPPAVDADGRFRFALETPHDPFVLQVWARRYEPFERLILPEPGGRFAETFRMP